MAKRTVAAKKRNVKGSDKLVISRENGFQKF